MSIFYLRKASLCHRQTGRNQNFLKRFGYQRCRMTGCFRGRRGGKCSFEVKDHIPIRSSGKKCNYIFLSLFLNHANTRAKDNDDDDDDDDGGGGGWADENREFKRRQRQRQTKTSRKIITQRYRKYSAIIPPCSR